MSRVLDYRFVGSNNLMLPTGRGLCRLVAHYLTQHHASVQSAATISSCFTGKSQIIM